MDCRKWISWEMEIAACNDRSQPYYSNLVVRIVLKVTLDFPSLWIQIQSAISPKSNR